MRTSILAVTFIATLASSASAQQAALPMNTFMSNKDIMALVDEAKADRKGDAALVAEPILLTLLVDQLAVGDDIAGALDHHHQLGVFLVKRRR